MHNQFPQPFVWTVKANDILKKSSANRYLIYKQNDSLHQLVFM